MGRRRACTGVIIEQYAATTVHLHVDETRQQQAAFKIPGCGRSAERVIRVGYCQNTTFVDQNDAVCHQPFVEQYATIDERLKH